MRNKTEEDQKCTLSHWMDTILKTGGVITTFFEINILQALGKVQEITN